MTAETEVKYRLRSRVEMASTSSWGKEMSAWVARLVLKRQ
jgi:hypothetical protein